MARTGANVNMVKSAELARAGQFTFTASVVKGMNSHNKNNVKCRCVEDRCSVMSMLNGKRFGLFVDSHSPEQEVAFAAKKS